MNREKNFNFLLMTAYYIMLSVITDLLLNDVPLIIFLKMKGLSLVYNLVTNYVFVKKFESPQKVRRMRQYLVYTLIFHGPLVGTVWLMAESTPWNTVGIFFLTNSVTSIMAGLWMEDFISRSKTILLSGKRRVARDVTRVVKIIKEKSGSKLLPPDA